MTETTEPETSAPPDLTADVESVNVLVRRSGCTVRDATLTLQGMSRADQQAFAASKKPNLQLAIDEDIRASLRLLEAAAIDPTDACRLGAPKHGDPPTWGDVVARMCTAGQAGEVPGLIEREKKKRGAA